VRDNQRRSRARRREYIAELERKIHECEKNGVPIRSVVPQNTIIQLENENKKLRELLASVGVEQALVDAHLNNGNAAPEVADNTNHIEISPEIAPQNHVCLKNRSLLMPSRRLIEISATLRTLLC